MIFLADAGALIAFLGAGAATMSQAGRGAMRGASVSPITVWKLTHKASLGKLPPLPTEQGSFSRHLATMGFQHHRLDWEDSEAASRLPHHHKDPMDRMLIASALRTDMTIVTSDAIFPKYGVRTVW